MQFKQILTKLNYKTNLFKKTVLKKSFKFFKKPVRWCGETQDGEEWIKTMIRRDIERRVRAMQSQFTPPAQL
jgi:hypothetical protein